ncbi:M28 family peptidase [Actinoplanes xinjiangensis]|uniref:Peptidase M28-like protein n=1 Tax=Actinoplanes xinjiangensis TaxID=512350 RepID=A0A316F549_9ACTN|nr:M28 family peptidase [Actinoplanes xinjiangensis]PWK39784.1 peptidase M28-like protein [Actinoplanes xinjiangensis]
MTGAPAASTTLAGLDVLLDQTSGERLAATVTMLAGTTFTGRRVGSPGGTAAGTWLADLLATTGATVARDTFTVGRVPQVYAPPAVSWQRGHQVVRLEFGRDVAVHLASADRAHALRAPLGAAGYGDPAGRWLLVPPGMGLFDAYGHADGAAGLLLARGVDADGWHYTMLAGPDPGPVPVLSIETGLHQRMTDAVRRADHDTTLTAATPIRRSKVTGTNLYARYRTVAAGGLDLLLTAHYDGVGDHPGLRQPAAADNGSGVAVVCEAARLLAGTLPDGIGLQVALLDAEETGALGSAHHARRLTDGGERPAVINVDGAGHLNTAAAVEAGGPAHRLLAVLDRAARHTGLPLVAGPVASDNRRYAAAGLAAVGIGAGMAGYHSPADTPDRVQTATMVALCRLIVATAWLAAVAKASLSSLIGDRR